MDIYQAIILGIIQGFTEFLPISSSAHLILLPKLTNLPDQGLEFDVMLHFGTLLAVVIYYKNSIGKIIYNFFTNNNQNPSENIGWQIIIATIPVGIVGLIFKDYIELNLRSTQIIAIATIFFALILYLAAYLHKKRIDFSNLITFKNALIIGLFQALALIPGTSRSGIVLTGALLVGLHYKLAIKFTFLLSVPIIILSAGLLILDVNTQNLNYITLFTGFFTAFITAYLTIYFFIKLIEKISLLPFIIYRIILGIVLLSL